LEVVIRGGAHGRRDGLAREANYDRGPFPFLVPSIETPPMPRRAAPHRGTDVHYGDSHDDADADDVDARPSKTQLKQQSQELQDLGVAVSELSAERLAAIDMPDRLRDAIETFRKTRSHEGRRRQMQYVGKLMREAVAAATLGSAKETLVLHETERWRTELMADDDAMTRWLQMHPDTDTQQLRSLVRQARRDAAGLAPEARQPKSFRELFLFIKPMMQASHV
jgi:ribosome-associated protein